MTDGEQDAQVFGRALHERRTRAGLSLADLASLVHFSRGFLSRIENGHRRVSRDLAELCDTVLDAHGELAALATDPGQDTPRKPRDAARRRPPSGGPARRPAPASGAGAGRFGAEFQRLLDRGDQRYLAGRMEEADEHYRTAHRLAEGDPEARATAAVRLARRWSDPGRVDHELLHLLNGSLAALAGAEGPLAAGLRLQLNAHLAKKLSMGISEDTAWPPAGPSRGAELARRTLDGLTPTVDDDTRCEVLTECRWGLYDFAPAAKCLSLSLQLLDCSMRDVPPYFRGEALIALAIDQLRVGRVHGASGTRAQHARHAARTRSTLARWQQCTLGTLFDLWSGRFDSASDWIFGESRTIVAGLEADLSVPADTLSQTRLGQAYWLLRERGRMADLFSSELAGGVEQHGYFPVWRAGLAFALCEVGEHGQAADRLLALARESEGFTRMPPDGWTVPALFLLAEVCAALDARGGHEAALAEAVPALRTRLARVPQGLALAGWPVVLLGPTDRAMGLLDLVAGEPVAALGRFRQAERLVVGSSAPHTARARAEQARALLRLSPGRRDTDPAPLLRSALATAESLGMESLAVQCRALLEQGPDRPAATSA
ncbi:helix-turn-helix domain-containing protein [Streptomyces cinnabarinus]|uniref:Helix-turn-helix domain-containing protein n=1 Tax=Streptomyces cinnabarinus TaxID=67287 RepID=A0ABY7K822_9ACTN|nr:helix-turn-helix transcriptional regulator [Streptomyces cinnabarinus]WAZ20529.1 helix-turn-helix domain-containing protein [Streptomyces cinnabarinus]